MASFTPSPGPRRSSRLRPSEKTPPRRLRAGNSRLTTPLVVDRREESVAAVSIMDVDENGSSFSSEKILRSSGETIFAQSEQLLVSFHSDLPVEVTQVLRNADFYRDAYTGCVDTLTGFALVASLRACFVWQHAQVIKGIPTCYIFGCPQGSSPPFHGLFPYDSVREPALVLLSNLGEMRFWDSIGIGLAGGDFYSTTNLGLRGDELVTDFLRLDRQTYVASTNEGQLFRVSVTSSGGKRHLNAQKFSRPIPSRSFSNLLPSLFSSPSTSNVHAAGAPGNISSISLGSPNSLGGRSIWTLVDTRLQEWDLKVEGGEEVVSEQDILELVRGAIRTSLPRVEQDNVKLDLELVDFTSDSVNGDTYVVLSSYAPTDQVHVMSMDHLSGVRRIYCLVYLTRISGQFTVDDVKPVPYQSMSSSGAPMHPRVQLVDAGKVVTIQFGDALAICARDSDYSDRLELRSSADMTLGVGIIDAESTILILTAGTIMKVVLNLENIAFPSNGRANLIKSIMTQAILYGSSPNNPLNFSFPPEVDEESLMQGASQLSLAVLQSDPEVVRPNHDLTAQISGRKDRLSWLIRFINDNAALEKMSQRSRQKLATDAEKLYACHQLWIQHNELLATNPTHSVLNDVVYAFMCEIQEPFQEDFMRAFFRTRVADLGGLVQRVPAVTLNTAKETGRSVTTLLPEANDVVMTVLKSAFDYRHFNTTVYGIQTPMIDAWTSHSVIIDVVQTLFETTARTAENPQTDDFEQRRKVYEQMPSLAQTLFAVVQERLEYLASPIIADEGAQREKDEIERRFNQLRPEVLETLRRSGHEEAAFSLAEQYRDFSSLADLCHREVVYPPSRNPKADRISMYIERFKEEFTNELYKWYIQHGELRVMFSQDQQQTWYMDNFFSTHPHPSISWLHDISKGWYGQAAGTLLSEAEQASQLDAKHLMLSIGKLAHVAQLQDGSSQEGSTMDAFHDELDFVSVHEALLQEFKSALQGLRGRQSLDTQVEAIIKVKASKLSDLPSLARIFKNLLRELLQGKVLSVEDTVDVLTLKDNTDTVEDYATALHLLARFEKIPSNRKLSAFRTVWRRAYVHDDWDALQRTVNVSDAELSAKFRSTAMYVTLRGVVWRDEKPEGYETVPNVALVVPTRAEITSRWPGMPAEQVESLVQDYNLECDKLGEMDLQDVFYRVRELVVEDMEWEGGMR